MLESPFHCAPPSLVDAFKFLTEIQLNPSILQIGYFDGQNGILSLCHSWLLSKIFKCSFWKKDNLDLSLSLSFSLSLSLSHTHTHLSPFLPTCYQLSSVTQSCPPLCDNKDHSTPGFPVHHQLLEPTQTHVHWVSDAIQPSHPLSPLLLPPSIFPSIRVFSNELVLHIRSPKYWSFSFSISPSNEYSELISFRMDWLDLFAVQGTLKSLLQHYIVHPLFTWGLTSSKYFSFFTWATLVSFINQGTQVALINFFRD